MLKRIVIKEIKAINLVTPNTGCNHLGNCKAIYMSDISLNSTKYRVPPPIYIKAKSDVVSIKINFFLFIYISFDLVSHHFITGTNLVYLVTQRNKLRFGKIHQLIGGISRKVLTEQLKSLERDGLIDRKQFEEIPLRVEYSVTEKSKNLCKVFTAIEKWSSIENK
jgi:hypothetical protein